MEANIIEDRGSDALKAHMSGCDKLIMRQTRRGWFQECLGCEAKTEFKYFIGDEQVFHSLEDTDCFCRICCAPCHPYTMVVKELNTDAEIVTVERPLRCASSGCKCCCYQEAFFKSNGSDLGRVKETCFCCVPSMEVYDSKNDDPLYLVYPPTCCGGICVNCCAEGNPCSGRGCCRSSFRIYGPGDGGKSNTNDPYLGVVLKKPKSFATEVFTSANVFEVDFPKNATVDQKGILMGLSIFINSVFYEGEE